MVGLTRPLQKRKERGTQVFRGDGINEGGPPAHLMSSAYGISATLEEAMPYVQVVGAGGHALYKAGLAAKNGECQ